MGTRDIGIFKLKSIQLPDSASHSFFYLNQFDVSRKGLQSGEIVALLIRYGHNLSKNHFTSLGPFLPQVPSNCIGASPVITQRLGLNDGAEIIVSVCQASSLTVISVRPKSNDDYNILARLHNLMENVILSQIRVVAPHQQMSLKIGNIIVDLVVEQIKPNGECGRLEKFTEIVVLDAMAKNSSENEVTHDALSEVDDHTSSFSSLVWSFFRWGRLRGSSDSIQDQNQTQLQPKDILKAAFKGRQTHASEYRVVLDKSSKSNDEIIYTNCGFKADSPTACNITKVPEKTVLFPSASDTAKKLDAPINCKILSLQSSNAEEPLEIYFSNAMLKSAQLQIGARVFIDELPGSKDIQSFKKVNSAAETELEENVSFWGTMEEIRCRLITLVECCCKLKHSSNALVIGPLGCGKTFLLNAIATDCHNQNIHHSIVNCKALRGKRIENLLKVLTGKWSEAAYREPSVLLLDDLDALMYLREEDGEAGSSGAYCNRVATLLTELTVSFGRTSRICVIASASSVSSLGPALASTRGPRLFGLVLKVPELTAEERSCILERLGVKVSAELVEKAHGYRVQDLADLVARVKLRTVVAGRRDITEPDVEAALEDTVPIALQGVQLQKDVPYSWSDVGGMTQVKTILDEIFRWPSQFPDVFATCPLRLQTGALLYGPPGCGKTLIAGAIANECGMNFKSVKGPELLSKFVGASEAAVRSLFERAQQARPCLVFFDELDSLAPRRGADSTGVTDRVVNQLLTELDGVEGRTGVWVLGASSRPDLIDPALLRPGRLDRVIFCPVPTLDERLRILGVLLRNLELAADVSLSDLATETEGFTGADLQAFLYNCQMKAIQETSLDMDADGARLVVARGHVEAALRESKPSLSRLEKLKYDLIFKRFQASKDSKKREFAEQPQKVTFA